MSQNGSTMKRIASLLRFGASSAKFQNFPAKAESFNVEARSLTTEANCLDDDARSLTAKTWRRLPIDDDGQNDKKHPRKQHDEEVIMFRLFWRIFPNGEKS
jgi:hypothetical protein